MQREGVGKYCVNVCWPYRWQLVESPVMWGANHYGDCGRSEACQRTHRQGEDSRLCDREAVARARVREVHEVNMHTGDSEVAVATSLPTTAEVAAMMLRDVKLQEAVEKGAGWERHVGSTLGWMTVTEPACPMHGDGLTGETLDPREVRNS